MMYGLGPLARLFLIMVQACTLVSFILVSVLFTMNLLIFSPLSALISGYTLSEKKQTKHYPLFSWSSSNVTLEHGLGLMVSIPVDQNTFLSKAFMNSMQLWYF